MAQMSTEFLKDSDFVRPAKPKNQAIVLIHGLPGDGKSTLGLSGAPDPTAFIDLDRRGSHAAAQALAEGKKIGHLPIDFPKRVSGMTDDKLKQEAMNTYGKIERNMDICVRESQRGNVRTIVIDTVTLLCDLAKLAVNGRVDKKNDDFGRSKHLVDTLVQRLIKTSREGEANLIMLAHAREIWSGNNPTGKFTYRGLEVLEADADWGGHLRLVRNKATKQKSQLHELEITKAGTALNQLGEVYKEADWEGMGPFVYGCCMNYPNSVPSDWE